eukprot:TRINITY_DN7107_c0_g1_i1.p1 TRINITY_DN7107_c0_g1~~TRINITY_DN7107_c0_g1_i1.p1  ORF type:complete len:225 (+),score=36.72 TRINITY_DN7107_c0_g1_i1:26-700(+)
MDSITFSYDQDQKHLSIVGQDITEIPSDFIHANETTQLSLNFNQITVISNLESFVNLKSLVLDNNELSSGGHEFPVMTMLENLFVNNNNIENLETFLQCLEGKVPSLTYLSMLKNSCCPNYFTGKGSNDYQRYRYTVVSYLPTLQLLDSAPVTEEERERGAHYRNLARPDSSQYQKRYTPTIDPGKALPESLSRESRTRVGVTKREYTGRESEGNRFIRDQDLG